MNYFYYKKFLMFVLVLIGTIQTNIGASSCGSNSILIPRSQSVDAARDLIGWQTQINRCGQECWYHSFAFTAEYQQSFRSAQLASCLFGSDVNVVSGPASTNGFCCGNDDNCALLSISGSQAVNRGANDWLADYFGLPTDFKSIVSFCPRIQNAIFDFNFYIGLDEWSSGMFFRIHFPLVWAKWNLRATENVITPGQNSYIAGYMSKSAIDNSQLQKSFLLATDGSNGTFGDVTQDFLFGVIGGGSTNVVNSVNANSTNKCSGKTRARIADVEAAMGYNFLCCDNYHLGLEIRGSGPAGNRPTGVFLFDPLIGNGHYWTLGGGLTSHYIFWQGCDEESSFGIWLDANVTHLFRCAQRRSFDFNGKPNSRYALLEQFTTPTVNLLAGQTGITAGGIAPNTQYVGTPGPATSNGGLFHAINKTTFTVQSSFNVQADVALKLAYQCSGFEWDLGYNLWARSREKICRKGDTFASGTYALKGDAQIYGFIPGFIPASAVPLSATESLSDIHMGTNTPTGTTFLTTQYDNPSIDNAQPAQDTTPVALVDGLSVGQINTSLQSMLLSDADVCYKGVPKAITNKIFTHLNYTFAACDNWTPFLGVGASAEIALSCNKNICNGTPTSNCGKNRGCAVSQWAVWLKTGIAYN